MKNEKIGTEGAESLARHAVTNVTFVECAELRADLAQKNAQSE